MSVLRLFGEITPEKADGFLASFHPHVSEVVISSPGGDIGSMLALFDAIRLREITVTGTGLLQSAAAVLLQAGKIRAMTRNSLLLFHEPEKDRQTGEISDSKWSLHGHLVELVVDRTGMSQIEGHDLFDGLFINPERAKNLNLIDRIVNPKQIPIYEQEVLS
jgi:ATP-dependent protease ClpP protease subunit